MINTGTVYTKNKLETKINNAGTVPINFLKYSYKITAIDQSLNYRYWYRYRLQYRYCKYVILKKCLI
jgi:hypothetical protein